MASVHKQAHALNNADNHTAGTNGTLLGTESSAVAEKAFGTAATAGNIVQRDGAGDVLVPTTPSSATAAASKAYVDATKQGLDIKDSVRVATTADLAATRSGNVLTADANGSINTAGIDGVTTLATTDRVLVKDESTGADNGIYTITDLGSAGTPFVLTRATDADASSEVTGGLFTFITEGTTNADTGWVLTTNDPITLNTTSLAFTQFSGVGALVAGDGIGKTSNTIFSDVAVATAAQQYGGIVKNRTSDGTGAAGADAGFLAVQTDNSDIVISAANAVGIKSGSRLDHLKQFTTYAGAAPTAAEMAAVLTAQGDFAYFRKASSSTYLCFRGTVTGGDPAADFQGVELSIFA